VDIHRMTFAPRGSGAQQKRTPPLRMAQAEFPFLLTKSLCNHRSVCKPRIVQTSNSQILNSARLHSGRGCPPARRGSLVERAGALGSIMISGAQIRAARGLLGWTTRELARRAIVSVSTVQLIENAGGRPNASREALAAVQNTLEAAGIEFLDGDTPGVRLHPKKQK
jgi:hypothetical protein